jgi:hypothetical protein
MAQLSPETQALITQAVSDESAAESADTEHSDAADNLAAATAREAGTLAAARDAHAKASATFKAVIVGMSKDLGIPIPQFQE